MDLSLGWSEISAIFLLIMLVNLFANLFFALTAVSVFKDSN